MIKPARELTAAERKWVVEFCKGFIEREDALMRQFRLAYGNAGQVADTFRKQGENFDWLVAKLVEFRDLAEQAETNWHIVFPTPPLVCTGCGELIPCSCVENARRKAEFEAAAKVFEKGQP